MSGYPDGAAHDASAPYNHEGCPACGGLHVSCELCGGDGWVSSADAEEWLRDAKESAQEDAKD